jgi:hypothetical protein
MTPEEVRSVACPRCGAPAGQRCREGGRLRRASHRERTARAELMLGWRAPGESPHRAARRKRWRASRPRRR